MLSQDIEDRCRASLRTPVDAVGLSKARSVITAVVLEGRSASEVARHYGVSRSWVYELVARYRTDGDLAFEPRSRRPRTRPDATSTTTIELVVTLRERLTREGLDAGDVRRRLGGPPPKSGCNGLQRVATGCMHARDKTWPEMGSDQVFLVAGTGFEPVTFGL